MQSPSAAVSGIGIYILGDEILSGKREDRHFDKVKELLAARGLALDWVMLLGDQRARCVEAFRQSLGSADLVFSFGGIGATPDDHTRQAVAEALGLPLVLHPEAERLIAERSAESGQPLTPGRLRMGEFPRGAEIIPNPYNKIPGFSVGRHYFLPGFPVMAWPMMEWVLDTHYGSLGQGPAEIDLSFSVKGLYEATVTPLLEELTDRHPQLRIYSLPAAPLPGQTQADRLLELGVKLPGAALRGQDPAARAGLEALQQQAVEHLRRGILSLGGTVVSEHRAER